MNQILTDEEIGCIGHDVVTNAHTLDYFARAIEQAIINKLNIAEPIAKIDYRAPYGIAFTLEGSKIKDGTKLFTHPPAPSVPEGYQLVPIEPTDKMIADGRLLGDVSYGDIYKAMLSAARSEE